MLDPPDTSDSSELLATSSILTSEDVQSAFVGGEMFREVGVQLEK